MASKYGLCLIVNSVRSDHLDLESVLEFEIKDSKSTVTCMIQGYALFICLAPRRVPVPISISTNPHIKLNTFSTMSSTIVDLTQDTPPCSRAHHSNENAILAKRANATHPSTRQPPLRDVLNNAQATSSRSTTQHTPRPITKALSDAIDGMNLSYLRQLVKKECETNARMRHLLESTNLVQGKEIDRYHHDTESEDDKESEIESELESEVEPEDSDEEVEEPEKKVYPIAIGDDEYTSRYAVCENCKERFDITSNCVRDCYWHEGKIVPPIVLSSESCSNMLAGDKELDYESDIWADHDERCHGLMDSFEDDPHYADGFRWTCCDADAANEGCKYTKHKAAVNEVVEAPVFSGGFKRKAEDDLAMPNAKR